MSIKNSIGASRRFAMAAALLLSALLSMPALAASTVSTPVHVLVTVPAGESAPADFSQRLAAWRVAGLVANVTRLDKNNANGSEGELSTLVILDFENEHIYEKWRAASAGQLPRNASVTRADLHLTGGTHVYGRNQAHYMVHIHNVSDWPAYRGFLDAYMAPLMGGQRDAGVLRGYRLYMEHGPEGSPRRSIWVAQYADADAYTRTAGIKREIRARLLEVDPGFARYRDGGAYKNTREVVAYYNAAYQEVLGQAAR